MNALIVIDMQNDFITGALGTREAEAIVPAVCAKINAARAAGDYVFFTRDTHEADYLSTQEGRLLPVAHCIRGTDGWAIASSLPSEGCRVIDKPSFGSLALADEIASLPEVTSVTLCGLCTDICVISNAMILKARLPELPISVDASCCAGVTPQSHETALRAMQMCQITILPA